jgi:hypothetical protein
LTGILYKIRPICTDSVSWSDAGANLAGKPSIPELLGPRTICSIYEFWEAQ